MNKEEIKSEINMGLGYWWARQDSTMHHIHGIAQSMVDFLISDALVAKVIQDIGEGSTLVLVINLGFTGSKDVFDNCMNEIADRLECIFGTPFTIETFDRSSEYQSPGCEQEEDQP